LQSCNTFGIAARARALVRIHSASDVQTLVRTGLATAGEGKTLVLGGGSNVVLTGDVQALVLKMEIAGLRLARETAQHWVVEAGAGVPWHDVVAWTVAQGWGGLENLALIPGTAGAAPVQNIGAYGLELQDRFDTLDAVDLGTGEAFSLNAAQCGFGYRDSVFKHTSATPAGLGLMGLRGRAVITRVRLALPKRWKPELGYLDLQRQQAASGIAQPTAQQIFDWVCAIRRAKLPDPQRIGNVGSFFKNPQVSAEQCADIIAREPGIVHYRLHDGSFKLAAAWLIDACGWRGRAIGRAAVDTRHALVLVNRGERHSSTGSVTGGEVMTLAHAIQTSVYERFGIRLEPEPVLV